MKKYLLLFTLFLSSVLFAQNNGITYQAILYKPNGDVMPGHNNATVPLASKNVCIQFTIMDAANQNEYIETVTVTTDQYGMVNLLIGTGTQVGGYAANFAAVDWTSNQKSLRVGLNINGVCSNYEEISNQPFATVPYAYSSQYATSAVTVTGVVPIENGGTNATTVAGAKLNLGLNLVDNTTDLNKPISTATQNALNLKENANNKSTDVTLSDVTNTKFPTELAVKTYVNGQIVANTNNLNAAITAVQNDVDANEIATTNALALKEDAVNKSTDVTLADVSNTKFPTELAVKTFVNGQVASSVSTLNSAITAVQNDVDANEIATTNALALKEDAVNKSTDVTLADVSNTKFPTELAVKTFVNGQVASSVSTLNSAITAVQNDVDANEIATTNALALKEDAVNKSTDVTLADVSNTKFPTELAVKTYVNNQLANIPAANVTGVLAIANGGTGSSLQNFVDLSTNQIVSGEKSFSSNTVVNANLNVNGTVNAPVVMIENSTFQTGTWGDNQWQSFTATSSGVLRLISIFGNGAIGSRNGTLNIYTGTGTSGTQLYSGTVALPPFSGWFDLNINSNVNVVSGNVYTFQILDPNMVVTPGGLVASENNLYAQGDYYSSVYGANSNYDLTFKAWVSTVAGGNITSTGTITSGTVTYPNIHGAANQVLTTNGSGTLVWTTPVNSASSLTGTLPIANGGTGSSIQNFVDLSSNQSINGDKIFSSNGIFNTQTIGKGNATGGENLAVGAGALNGVSTGTRNTAIGNSAMQNYVGTSFDNNTSVGYANLVGMTTGFGNTSVGAESLISLTDGNSNTSIGNQSLINTTGSNNVGVGKRSGDANSSGNNNTFIGTETSSGSNNLNNATAIGYGAMVNSSNTIQLGNTSIQNVNTYGSITANAEISSEITSNLIISNSNAEQYKGKVLVCNPNAPISITFENNLPIGFNCMVLQKSLDANTITFNGGSGVTVRNRNNYTATAGNYAIATIVNIGGGIIVTAGDMQ